MFNRVKILSVLVLMIFLVGCGNTKDKEETENLNQILDSSTSISLLLEYDTHTHVADGSRYQLLPNEEIVSFRYEGTEGNDFVRRGDDYSKQKYDELVELIKSSGATEYDINEHVDENGKIQYEKLSSAILVTGTMDISGTVPEYLLVLSDTSKVEEFFINLRENSTILYAEPNSTSGSADSDLISSDATNSSSTDLADIVDYTIKDGKTMVINLKDDGDGNLHYAVIAVSLSLDSKNEDYESKYSNMEAYDNVISDTIKTVVCKHTIQEMRTEEDAVKEEILEQLRGLFKSSVIVRVNFSNATYQ